MNATTVNLLEGLLALAPIILGTLLCVRHLEGAATLFRIRSSTIAVVIPAFGPAGWATIDVFQAHHGLRVISSGFTWASALALLVAGGLSLVLGIRSINANTFRNFLVCLPIPVACVLSVADHKISRFEAVALALVYVAFIASIWKSDRLDKLAPSLSRAGPQKWTTATAFLSGLAFTVAGSVLLIACARMQVKLHHRALGSVLAGSGMVVQIATFAYLSARQNRSELAVASVMGSLAFTSTVTLAAFGFSTHNQKFDPSAHLTAALAMLAVPAFLFSLAFKQAKQIGPGWDRHDTDAHMDNIFAWRNLKRDLSNFQILHHRKAAGNLVAGMNSGTHWVTVMLASAIAKQHGLALPRYFSFEAAAPFVGTPRSLVRQPGVPAIILSHNHPAALVAASFVRRLLPYPKQVVLVRDIREVLVSAYVKWMPNGEIPFSEFVRGDPSNRSGNVCDVWWYISYLNRWGDVKAGRPEDTLIVHYEEMVDNPGFWLRRIGAHFGIDFRDDAIAAALTFQGKNDVLAKRDPRDTERVIADPALKSSVQFSADDLRELRNILSRHLRYDYGYDYGLRGVPLISISEMGRKKPDLRSAAQPSIRAPAST